MLHNVSLHLHKILLVEDEPKLGKSILSEFLEKGFQMDLAFDGREGEHFFAINNYDLVILDINLPYISGLDLCKNFRKKDKNIPIIMLTALGEIDDKLEAFSSGADDYILKPFHFKELLACVQVFLKRNQILPEATNEIKIGNLSINLSNKNVVRNGQNIALTAKEFALLTLLAKAGGQLVSKQEIAEKVWNMDFETSTNTIEVYINFLRNKIDKSFNQKLIHTKAGFGYYLKEL